MTERSVPRPGSRIWRGRGAPVVTLSLMAVTTLAWIASLIPALDLQERWAYVPALSATEPWRALTSALTHAGFQHLLFNMIGLFLFGGFLERSLGRAFLGVTYVAAALGGSVCALLLSLADYTLVNPNTMFVGASGAVYGLVGVLLVPTRKLDRNWGGVLVYLLLGGLFLLVQPNIAWEVHLGGLVAGFALGCLRLLPPRAVGTWLWGIAAACGLVAGVAALYTVGAVVELGTGLAS